MSTTFQTSKRYVSKHSKRIVGLLLMSGLGIILITNDRHIFHKSFKFLNDIVKDSKAFTLPFNTSSKTITPTLCIGIQMYGEQTSYFPVLALALRHTGLDKIRIYITNTDDRTDTRQLKQTINFINKLVVRMDYITYVDLGAPCTQSSYGFCMTDRLLNYLYKQHMQSSSICQYVVFTNGDNFYLRTFGTRILPYMQMQKDIIAWGFVSHHYKEHYRESIDNTKQRVPQIVDGGTEKCTPVELKVGMVDLGSVAYRLAFLHKHNLYFRLPDGTYYKSGSDGYFVEKAARLTNASVILRQTLFVHQ